MEDCPMCGRNGILIWLLDRVQHACDPSKSDFALAGPAK